jgi:ATP synthase F1 complex assembly factor 2
MISFSRQRVLPIISISWKRTKPCNSTANNASMVISSGASVKLLQQHRPLSSSFSPHNRIAGRKRFYKVVGVDKVESPDTLLLQLGKKSKEDEAQPREPTELLQLLAPRRSTAPIGSSSGSTATATTTTTDWYTVTLDGKPLRTPAGIRLAIPSLPLAVAIAAEWDSQQTILRPVQMPLMTSVCTALDQTLPNRMPIIHKCTNFLYNDTTCYFTDPKEDRVLYQRQKKYWHKLHDYIAAHVTSSSSSTTSTTTTASSTNINSLSVRPALATTPISITNSPNPTTNLFGNLPHPEELVSFCNNYLHQLDIWHLTALHSIATETKSLLIALAALDDGFSEMDDINYVINAGRVEEEFQIENWGLVEGGHDYDRLNASITIGAARLMLDMIRK